MGAGQHQRRGGRGSDGQAGVGDDVVLLPGNIGEGKWGCAACGNEVWVKDSPGAV